MPTTQKIHKLLAKTRSAARAELVKVFLEENCGSGKGDLCAKYTYEVERYGDYKILLKRPATLNKGFDFTVHTDGIFFRSKSGKTLLDRPSHQNIIDTLTQVKEKLPADQYFLISEQMQNIFNLEDLDLSKVSNFYFIDCQKNQRPIAIILLAIKWLFIEQDVTYWNWTGRIMFMNGLCESGLITNK